MARFVQVPAPVQLRDPVTDDVLPDEMKPVWSWERTWRTMVSVAASKGTADALALIDLRKKGSGRTPGEWFELTEDEYRLVEAEFRRPDHRFVGVSWVFSAESHQRAVLDAPSKMPAAVAETNGATAAAS
jgi:hypothetical protein